MVTKQISQNVTISAEDGSVRLLVNPDGSINVNTGGGTTADVNLSEVGGDAITLGQKAMADSLPVVLASDQSAIPVAGAVTPADNFANPTTAVSTFALGALWDGATWDMAPGNSVGGAYVQGGVASGVADAGNPVKIGAVFNSPIPTYTAGQRGDLQIDNRGSLRTAIADGSGGGSSPSVATVRTPSTDAATSATGLTAVTENLVFNSATWDRQRGNTTGTIVIPPQGWSYAAATGGIVNTTTAVTIKGAAGANVRNYLSGLTISTDTLGAATELAVRDGAGGTVLWRGKLQTTSMNPTNIQFPTPLFSTANTLLEVVTLTAVTGGVYVDATGYTAP